MPYAACVSGRSSSGTRVQGERKKRGQRSLGLRAEVFQPKGAEDSCIAAAFSMPSMSRIPPAIRFELPGRCNYRPTALHGLVERTCILTHFGGIPPQPDETGKPEAPKKQKKRPAGNACRPEAFQPKGAEVLRARRTSFSMSRTLGHVASRAVSTSRRT